MSRIRLMASLMFAFAASIFAAERLARGNLLQFRDSTGRVAPVKTVADWQKRRAGILSWQR
ncbi:MAG: hypothetical protein ACREH8_19165 [Opitutaceae bacterium]